MEKTLEPCSLKREIPVLSIHIVKTPELVLTEQEVDVIFVEGSVRFLA